MQGMKAYVSTSKHFGQMLAEKVQPNNLTFVLDLSTCSQWSNWEKTTYF